MLKNGRRSGTNHEVERQRAARWEATEKPARAEKHAADAVREARDLTAVQRADLIQLVKTLDSQGGRGSEKKRGAGRAGFAARAGLACRGAANHERNRQRVMGRPVEQFDQSPGVSDG